ncbi:MAG: oligosaccharide flippase family protein, partial [Oscillospiraceae bacterium]
MSDSKKNTFFGGAAVLMAGALIVKVIGACYQIPLTTVLGKVGMGHFKNAYIIFTLMLTIATAGLPVALSKAISEANALGKQNQVQKTFHVALGAFLVLGGLGFLVLFFGAGPLAAMQGDSGAKFALQALAPCVLFVCASSAFRGYAQGHSDMVPTSVSQVIEAVLKLVVGLLLAGFLMTLTFQSEAIKLEVSAAGGIIGVTSGAFVALIYLIFHQRRNRQKERAVAGDTPDSSGKILANLVKIAIPITLGASVASIISVIDANLVQNQLQNALNLSETTAVGLYGTYQSAVTLDSSGKILANLVKIAIPIT